MLQVRPDGERADALQEAVECTEDRLYPLSAIRELKVIAIFSDRS